MINHVLWLGVVPPCIHLMLLVLFGLEAESSSAMLFSTAFAAFFVGTFVGKKGYGPILTSLAAAWPVVPAAHWQWHWALGMPSPGGAAQQFVRGLGWEGASMTAAVAALALVFGTAGLSFMRCDRWFKKKTGHSLLQSDS